MHDQCCPALVSLCCVALQEDTGARSCGNSQESWCVQLQGIVGETYNRMLAGDTVQDPESPLFLPNDYAFHGMVGHEGTHFLILKVLRG